MLKIYATSSEFGVYSEEAIAKVLQPHGIALVRNDRQGPMAEADFSKLSAEYEALIVYSGHDQMTAAVMQHFPKLKVIARHGIGYDAIDVQAAAARRIIVTNTQEGAFEERAVSDLALGMLLTLVRNIIGLSAATKAGAWQRPVAGDLFGRVLGIIGLGRIGKMVAKKAQAFGLKVIAADNYRDEAFAATNGIAYVELDELLANADFISLHCPLTASTTGIIGERELALVKPGLFLINCARGALVQEAALYSALVSGRVAGAGIDVFAQEPPHNNQLLTLPNVVATPHIGAYTTATINAMDLTVVQACVDVLMGTTPGNIVNRAELAIHGLIQ